MINRRNLRESYTAYAGSHILIYLIMGFIERRPTEQRTVAQLVKGAVTVFSKARHGPYE